MGMVITNSIVLTSEERGRLGLSDKKKVVWKCPELFIPRSNSVKPGFYLEEGNQVDLYEVYRSCLLRVKSVVVDDWVERDCRINLIGRSLKEIDFTHYGLGFREDITFGGEANEHIVHSVCPISFYRER